MTDQGVDGTIDDVRDQFARLGVFMRRTLRFWRVALSVLVVGALACGALLMFRKPAYRSETVILYSEGLRMADDNERPDTARSVTLRLKEILMSRAALDAMAREFDLYPDVRRTLGPVDAVEELRRHIEFRAPGGDTFSIAFKGSSPEEAQRVTRRLGEQVVGQDSDLRRKQALVTRDFLETEERATEAGLRAREEELASFMAAHPRFAFDATPLSTGAAIRASLGATAVTPQPNAVFRSWGSVNSARNVPRTSEAPSPSPLPPSRGDVREATAEVARATAAVAAARANLADLTTRFTSAHPDVRAGRAELERETSRLAAATTAAHSMTEQVALKAESTRSTGTPSPPPPVVRTAIVVTPSKAAPPVVATAGAPPGRDVVALETDWVKLTRGVTEARQHQDQVEAALFKANILASSESGGHGVQVTIIDPAFLPRSPVPPGKTAIVGIFVAVSLFLGALAAILRTILDDRVYDARDLTGVSEILAEIPRVSSRRAHAHG